MKFIFTFLLLFSYSNFSFCGAKISPELDKFMELKSIPEELLHKNFYIGWLGINYPSDDWMTINYDIYKHNDHVLNQEMRNGKLSTNLVFDPLENTPHAPKNYNLLIELPNQEKSAKLLYINDFLMHNQHLYTFKQPPITDKQYSDIHDFFPCKEYLKADCLQIMEMHRSHIEKVLDINSILLKRFQGLVRESEHNYRISYNDMSASNNIVYSTNPTQLFQLNLSDALMDFLNNKQDDGLEKLMLARKSIDLSYEDQSLSTIIQLMLLVSFTQFLDQTMDTLLDSGRLDNYLDDPRVEWIVRPYPKNIGSKLNEAIILGMMANFKSITYPYIKVLTTAPEGKVLSDENEYIVLLYLQDRAIRLPPAVRNLIESLNNQTLPDDWKQAQQLVELRNLVFKYSSLDSTLTDYSFSEGLTADDNVTLPRFELDKFYVDFFQNIDMKPKEALAYLNIKYSSNLFFNDYYSFLLKLLDKNKENILLSREVIDELLAGYNISGPERLIPYSEFEQYWLRIYEQQNYHQLVYLKYLIMKDKIVSSKVDSFLISMGDLAKNTITHEPYEYDEKTKVLSTPFPVNSRYLPTNIREIYLDNKNMEQFQVTIP